MNNKPTRRNFLAVSSVACTLTSTWHKQLSGQTVSPKSGAVKSGAVKSGAVRNGPVIDQATQKAIDRGLTFLAKRQNDNGSFGTSTNSRDVGVCSLAGLAFLGSGSTPGRGKYGRQSANCLDYVLNQCDRNGYIHVSELNPNRPMYGHGFGAMYLAECFGMSKRADHRQKLGKAVRLVINSQNDEGGWRYLPRRSDSDLSVTVCQMMAVRAAKDAGLFVEKSVVDKATKYLLQCQNPDGGFRYQKEKSDSTFARTAAAVVGLYSAGIYEGTAVDKGLSYLQRFHAANSAGDEQYFFYGHYYAALAMSQGDNASWKSWYIGIRNRLLEMQNETDGSWQNSVWSPEYGTALATIILQLPSDLVPIFRR